MSTTAAICNPTVLAVISAAYPNSLAHAAIKAKVNGHKIMALVDTCSSDSYISMNAARKLKLKIHSSCKSISMASTSLNTHSPGYSIVDLQLSHSNYPSIQLGILENLCCELLLGQDFQKMHKTVSIEYGGIKPELKITGASSHCALATARIPEPSLFPNLPAKCVPIATKSRRFGMSDQEFIK